MHSKNPLPHSPPILWHLKVISPDSPKEGSRYDHIDSGDDPINVVDEYSDSGSDRGAAVSSLT